MNLKEIIDFPFYMMDIDTGQLFSFFNGMREVKGRKKDNTEVRWFCLRRKDGVMCYMSRNRLWYAAQNSISVVRIPSNLKVTRTNDGEFHLLSNREWAEQLNKDKAIKASSNRIALLERRAMEIGILIRCYESGNCKEAYEYLMSIKETCIVRYQRSYGGRSEDIELLYEVAIDMIMTRLKLPSCRMSDFTNNVIKNMHKEHERMRKQRRAKGEWMYQNAKRI